jgi:O-antigen ligase
VATRFTPAVSGFGFALFLAANAVLFVRPADLLVREDLPIFQYMMIACLVVCLPAIVRQLSLRSLAVQPITVSLLGIFACVPLSHLSHFRFGDALSSTYEFSKLMLYYLLLVAAVDTPDRLRRFITWFLGVIAIVVSFGFLQYFKWIEIPELPIQPFRQTLSSKEAGDFVLRIASVGVFNNPNDLARIILIAMPLALYVLVQGKSMPAQIFWAVVLVMFLVALALTYSRGGFLGFAAGLAAFLVGRFGAKKSLLLVAIGLPIALLVFQGRQTELEVSEGTGQLRILMWSDGFQLLRESPLLGIGLGEYIEQLRTVAHNSFVQCFVELGLLGGSCFLAAFFIPLRAWLGLCGPRGQGLPADLRRLTPYLIAMFVGYGVSLLSSTRNQQDQTYLVFGLATVYFNLARSQMALATVKSSRHHLMRSAETPAVRAVRFATQCNGRLLVQMLALGFAALMALDLFIRMYANYAYKD